MARDAVIRWNDMTAHDHLDLQADIVLFQVIVTVILDAMAASVRCVPYLLGRDSRSSEALHHDRGTDDWRTAPQPARSRHL
jgi:hypothetical protein